MLQSSPAHTIHKDIDVWPNSETTGRREDYVFLRERYGVEHRGGALLSKGRGWSDTLAVQIGREWHEMPEAFWLNYQLCLPHLAKVVEINRTFTLLRARHQAALAALDAVGIGMCVAQNNGNVLVVNQEARRIFSLNDGVTLGGDKKLAARTSQVTAQIQAAIEQTAQTAIGKELKDEVRVIAPRHSAAESYIVEICPLRDSQAELERNLMGSLICIIDPENNSCISTEALSVLCQLSQAEASVCAALCKGSSQSEIAETRNVSPETVRSQVKSIYAKTGASNRIELVRKAITTHPPIM